MNHVLATRIVSILSRSKKDKLVVPPPSISCVYLRFSFIQKFRGGGFCPGTYTYWPVAVDTDLEQVIVSGGVPELLRSRHCMPIGGELDPFSTHKRVQLSIHFFPSIPQTSEAFAAPRPHKFQMNSFPSHSNGATDNDATQNEDKLVAILRICIRRIYVRIQK